MSLLTSPPSISSITTYRASLCAAAAVAFGLRRPKQTQNKHIQTPTPARPPPRASTPLPPQSEPARHAAEREEAGAHIGVPRGAPSRTGVRGEMCESLLSPSVWFPSPFSRRSSSDIASPDTTSVASQAFVSIESQNEKDKGCCG